MSVLGAAGDRRRALEELRDVLAREIDSGEVEPRDLAALSRQFVAVLAELDGLPPAEGTSRVDDLGSRRAERKARAAGS